jgi:hypothetical protein
MSERKGLLAATHQNCNATTTEGWNLRHQELLSRRLWSLEFFPERKGPEGDILRPLLVTQVTVRPQATRSLVIWIASSLVRICVWIMADSIRDIGTRAGSQSRTRPLNRA